jgi:hypothetical protein
MKSTNAFTILEVLIAMSILTGAIFILIQMQMNSLNIISTDRDDIDKVFLMKKELYKFFINSSKRYGVIKDAKNSPVLENPDKFGFSSGPSGLEIKHDKEPPVWQKQDKYDLETIKRLDALTTLQGYIYIVTLTGKWKRNNKDNTRTMFCITLKET